MKSGADTDRRSIPMLLMQSRRPHPIALIAPSGITRCLHSRVEALTPTERRVLLWSFAASLTADRRRTCTAERTIKWHRHNIMQSWRFIRSPNWFPR
jgi:hypothetical protein